MINKRIKLLKQASGENDLITELIKCEITSWTSLSTDSPKSSTEFPIDTFDNIKSFYGYLISALKSTEKIKSKSGNLFKIDSNEIDDLLKFYDFLLHISSVENLSYLMMLKVFVFLHNELVTMF